MNDNLRCLYDNSFEAFLQDDENAILGLLCDHYHGDARTTTREAWKGEISVMRELISRLNKEDGRIIFEYDIPRLGKRIDAYRVLLTRARAGMVICVPTGNPNKNPSGFWEDSTRLPEYYDGTYQYLKRIGIEEI